MTTGRLFICATCDRHAQAPTGRATRGQTLAAACRRAAADAGSSVVVRSVECLNGCLHPAMAALTTSGRVRVRLAMLSVEDAPALIEAAELHAQEAAPLTPAQLPQRLRSKLAGKPETPIAA